MRDIRDQGFARLFSDSREVLSRYVRRLVRSRSAAEEIVQEAFLRTYTQGEVSGSLRPYLFSVARNLAFKTKRHDQVVNACAVSFGASDLHAAYESPEEAALADERIRALKEAIAALPPQCRAAFTLRMFHDRSYKEIAAHLGISAKTVEKHIATGAREVRAALVRRYKDVREP